MERIILSWILLICVNQLSATIYEVGSSKAYLSPNALFLANVVSDGDTIRIDGETYSETACLARWTVNNLVIIGVNGRPHLEANGSYISGKGIWVISGNNITVENIEFSGAKVPDLNGAGIRFEAKDLTVRHCYFHHNEMGILSGSPYEGTIIVEYSEFAYNGFGDGYSHNIYVNHSENFIFRYNYTHHSIIGHCVKSRANHNFILYNRIMDEEEGNSSRLIDIPNGGQCVIMGNVMMQGPNAENKNAVGYGLEGLVNTADHDLFFINNTLISTRPTSCIFVNTAEGAKEVKIINNIFGGLGDVIIGPSTEVHHNLVEPIVSNIGFVDASSYDYELTSNSLAIDGGVAVDDIGNISLTPTETYVHTTSNTPRISIGQSIDIGAYEYGTLAVSPFDNDLYLSIYPNPTADYLLINSNQTAIRNILIFDNTGKKIRSLSVGQSLSPISVKELEIGVYRMCLVTEKGIVWSSIVKI